jgi:hypothetical protein
VKDRAQQKVEPDPAGAKANLNPILTFLRIQKKYQANYINALAVTILRFFEPAGHYIG